MSARLSVQDCSAERATYMIDPIHPIHVAYLVLWVYPANPSSKLFGLVRILPRVVDAGIYSERTPTTMSARQGTPVVVLDWYAASFDEARKALIRSVEGNPQLEFVRHMKTYRRQLKTSDQGCLIASHLSRPGI